jgi:hypothetical protein
MTKPRESSGFAAAEAASAAEPTMKSRRLR